MLVIESFQEGNLPLRISRSFKNWLGRKLRKHVHVGSAFTGRHHVGSMDCKVIFLLGATRGHAPSFSQHRLCMFNFLHKRVDTTLTPWDIWEEHVSHGHQGSRMHPNRSKSTSKILAYIGSFQISFLLPFPQPPFHKNRNLPTAPRKKSNCEDSWPPMPGHVAVVLELRGWFPAR